MEVVVVMGVEMRLSAIPVNLTHAARRALEGVEIGAETACVAAYRARLDGRGCLDRVDLTTTSTIAGWLEVVGFDGDSDGSRDLVRHRLRRALDTIAKWPRELTVFHDPISDRRWLMSGGVTSGDQPTDVSHELDLVAESGICDRAVTLA